MRRTQEPEDNRRDLVERLNLPLNEKTQEQYRTLSGRAVNLAGVPAFVLAELQHLSQLRSLDRATSFVSTSFLVDSRSAAALLIAIDLLLRISLDDADEKLRERKRS